jgi:sortase A
VFKSPLLSRVLGVVGELLITFGVVVLLFLAWQLWVNDAIQTTQQQAATAELEKQWADGKVKNGVEQAPVEDFGTAPAFAGVAEGQQFATIFIPRLGPESSRVIMNGIDLPSILNKGYYGRYPDTQWPGEGGNFALAVHRTNWGSPFGESPKLESGDKIYVQTQDGYYTYVFRNYEYVMPTAVDVLLPVPGTNLPANGQSLITITTCNPLLGDAERLIFYGVLESWQPTDAGPPKEMAETMKVAS